MGDARLSILREHEGRYELCAYCPKMCRFSCPVAEADARETLTPWGKMSAPFLALRGTLPLEAAFETSWGCTGCGHCTEYCLHGNDVPAALAGLRAQGVAAGVDSPVTDAIRRSYAKHGNPSGKTLGAALRALVPAALRDEDAPIVFFPGCSAPVDEPAGVRAAMRILETLGTAGVGVPSDGTCCGSALHWAGLPRDFDAHADAFVKRFGRRKTLVVADASCAWTLRVLYPERGHRIRAQVLHASEWIAGFFRERVLKPREKVKGRFVYHDPCFLARRLDVVDEPRAILAAVLAEGAGELAWNRRDTVCCGGGALLPHAMPETAARMTEARAAEARAAGATIVTSCATCVHRFREGGADAVDLLSLVARAVQGRVD